MMKTRKIVYVIDDDGSVRKSFARLLRSERLECETFSSPEEFLNVSRQEKNACIVADIRMPGSTGFDLAEMLNSSKMRIPLIMVSASDDAQVREYAHELGAVAFFRKPVDDQALLDAIWWAIAKRKEND
jgi:FixJ family two-component response regulator